MAAAPLVRNTLAETIRGGGLGLAMITRHAYGAEIAVAAASCGFDAIYLDLEHTAITVAAAAQVCIAALLAGITPLVRLPRLAAALECRADLIGKLEFFNPLGSVKDRIGVAMIDAAEADGRLRPGTVIV